MGETASWASCSLPVWWHRTFLLVQEGFETHASSRAARMAAYFRLLSVLLRCPRVSSMLICAGVTHTFHTLRWS